MAQRFSLGNRFVCLSADLRNYFERDEQNKPQGLEKNLEQIFKTFNNIEDELKSRIQSSNESIDISTLDLSTVFDEDQKKKIHKTFNILLHKSTEKDFNLAEMETTIQKLYDELDFQSIKDTSSDREL